MRESRGIIPSSTVAIATFHNMGDTRIKSRQEASANSGRYPRFGHQAACLRICHGRPRNHASSRPSSNVTTAAVVAIVRASFAASCSAGTTSGIGERTAETNSRCVLTPYGVHVINVTRSSLGTIFSFDVSFGSITEIRSTR